MSHWHYMMLEHIPENALMQPTIGEEPDLSREQAHGYVQTILDGLAAEHAAVAKLAAVWREDAKDDTVYYDRFIFTIFECAQPTCNATFQAVGDEWAGIFRRSGLDVTVAKIPGV